jgi:hypothetical protein
MTDREDHAFNRVVVKGGLISIAFECQTSEWVVSQPSSDEPILGIADTLYDALTMAYDALDLEQQANEQDEPPATTRDPRHL